MTNEMSNQRDSMRLRYPDSLGERSSATTPAAALGGPVFVVDGVAPPRSQPGILLLDDDPFMLGVQSRMLLDMGYPKVSTAGSAEAAVRMLQREKQTFDVILCDLNMPGMDGIEFLQILNASSFGGSVIPVSYTNLRAHETVLD